MKFRGKGNETTFNFEHRLLRINIFLDNRTFSPFESELDAVAADPSERVYDNHPRLPDDAVRDVFGKSFRGDREPSFSVQQHSRVDLGEQPVALIVVLADLLKFISSSSLFIVKANDYCDNILLI